MDTLLQHKTYIHIFIRNLSITVCYHPVRKCPQHFLLLHGLIILIPLSFFLPTQYLRYSPHSYMTLLELGRVSVAYFYHFLHLILYLIAATLMLLYLEWEEVFGLSTLMTIEFVFRQHSLLSQLSIVSISLYLLNSVVVYHGICLQILKHIWY